MSARAVSKGRTAGQLQLHKIKDACNAPAGDCSVCGGYGEGKQPSPGRLLGQGCRRHQTSPAAVDHRGGRIKLLRDSHELQKTNPTTRIIGPGPVGLVPRPGARNLSVLPSAGRSTEPYICLVDLCHNLTRGSDALETLGRPPGGRRRPRCRFLRPKSRFALSLPPSCSQLASHIFVTLMAPLSPEFAVICSYLTAVPPPPRPTGQDLGPGPYTEAEQALQHCIDLTRSAGEPEPIAAPLPLSPATDPHTTSVSHLAGFECSIESDIMSLVSFIGTVNDLRDLSAAGGCSHRCPTARLSRFSPETQGSCPPATR